MVELGHPEAPTVLHEGGTVPIGTTEILVILLLVVLLFGAKRLPETARGLGRSLRIFKAETKGLTDTDDAPQVERSAETNERTEG